MRRVLKRVIKMKFENIVVGGITSIVINRKAKWTLSEGIWNYAEKDNFKSHAEMIELINYLKHDIRYRMWVHGDTLNIVRR